MRTPGAYSGSGLAHDREAELGELLCRERRRSARERVAASAELREGDDLAQVVGVAELHRDAVDAGCDAAVGRRSEAQRAQEESEALLGLVGSDPDHVQHARLELGAIDTDRPRG